MRKLIRVLSLALAALLALGLVSAMAEEKTKVTIWHTFTKAQEAYINKAVTDFNASQDKIVVESLTQPVQGFTDAVYNAVNEGIGPDIIFNYGSEAAKYVEAGQLIDLSQYIYDEEIGIKDFDTSMPDILMNGEVKGFTDGLIHYLPGYTTGPILFYNKTLFDELGLVPPTTWEELEKLCAVIREKKDIPGFAIDSLTDFMQMMIMESDNSGYIDVENKAVLFDTKEVREKFQWAVDMVKKGYFAIKPSGNYFSEDFNGGVVASFMGSCAGLPYTKPNGFEFTTAPTPAEKWYPSWNRGLIGFYYKDDVRAEATYEFIKYFISADVNAGWVEACIGLAPYAWTKEAESYKAFITAENAATKSLKDVEANLRVVGPLPSVPGAADVRNCLKAALEKAAAGDMTVEAAWDECVKLSNAALQGK